MAQRRRQSDQALALLYHARAATPFLSEGGQPSAVVPSSVDSCRVLPLRSADFRDWLTANYYAEFETAPSALALQAVLRTLEARARSGELPAMKVDPRVSFEGDPFIPSKVFLDLANTAGEVVEITSQGWSITDNLHHSFRQSPGMLPLASPLANPQFLIRNPLPGLGTLFNLSATGLTQVYFWLVAALHPIGPYPILVLRGPAASGKSTLARALRSLIDPSSAPLRRLPARDRELMQLALNNWILVFDHVHRIPPKISEALCGISSGEAIETAQPDYRDSALTEIARPIILIAPVVIAPVDHARSAWSPAPSLSTRSLTIHLAPIAEPRTEAALSRDFEALRGSVVAALADAVSCTLGNLREVELAHASRFPDCEAWAIAAAPALGADPAAIAEAVNRPESMWLASQSLHHKTQKHA
jgi:energy-coupling factor transporter ATP-binding protein EcfA2